MLRREVSFKNNVFAQFNLIGKIVLFMVYWQLRYWNADWFILQRSYFLKKAHINAVFRIWIRIQVLKVLILICPPNKLMGSKWWFWSGFEEPGQKGVKSARYDIYNIFFYFNSSFGTFFQGSGSGFLADPDPDSEIRNTVWLTVNAHKYFIWVKTHEKKHSAYIN